MDEESQPVRSRFDTIEECLEDIRQGRMIIVTDDAGAVSGADGRFRIDDVPPGTYELRVWHEALKGAPRRITVVAGKPTEINYQLTMRN